MAIVLFVLPLGLVDVLDALDELLDGGEIFLFDLSRMEGIVDDYAFKVGMAIELFLGCILLLLLGGLACLHYFIQDGDLELFVSLELLPYGSVDLA